jgi:hypothetical protein
MFDLEDNHLTYRLVPFGRDSFLLANGDEEICRIILDDGGVAVNRKYSASENAKAFWDAVTALRPPYPVTINAPDILSSRLQAFADSFRLVNGQEEICRITFEDGEIRINSKYSASQAATAFWDAVVARDPF